MSLLHFDWNIVESGVKYHKPNPLHFELTIFEGVIPLFYLEYIINIMGEGYVFHLKQSFFFLW
jgi:hypothetical protein